MPEKNILDAYKKATNSDTSASPDIVDVYKKATTPVATDVGITTTQPTETEALDFSNYKGYFGEGQTYLNKGLEEARAQSQSTAAKWGRGISNTVTQTVGDIAKDAGYLLDFENYNDIKSSAQEGFGNWFSDAMQSVEDKLKLPVYRTKASLGFSPLHAGWWADALPSIASSVSMLIPTEGAIWGLSKVGKVLGGKKVIQGIEELSGLNNLSGKLKGISGAVISRHMESLMEGGQTYQDVYNKSLQAGKTEDEAKQIAGEAAANNYKLNWAALIQDIPEYMFLHKTFKGETNLLSKQGLGQLAKIGLLEGSEEAYQYVTDKEAARAALIKGKVLKDDQTSFSDRMTDYAKDGEFWTSAFLGSLGGLGFGAYGLNKNNKTQKDFDNYLEAHKAILMSDPIAFDKAQDKKSFSVISDHVANGTLDKFREGLKNILSNPERIPDEDKQEVTKRVNKTLEVLDYADNLSKNLAHDPTLSKELLKLKFGISLEQKQSENRLTEINQKLSPIIAKDQSLDLDSDLHAYKITKLTYEAIKDNPALEVRAKELKSAMTEIHAELLKAHGLKNLDELNNTIISSNDEQLKNLLGHKEQERADLKEIKKSLIFLNTKAGKEITQQLIDEKKAADEKEKKRVEDEAKQKEKDKSSSEETTKNNQDLENIQTKSTVTTLDISDEEFNKFVDHNEVSASTIDNIAKKIILSKPLTDKEQAIRQSRSDEIEGRVLALKPTDTENTTSKANDTQSTTSTTIPTPDTKSKTTIDLVQLNSDNVLDSDELKDTFGLTVRLGGKTTIVNFAYLHTQYEELETKEGKIKRTLYDENGVPLRDRSDIRLASPNISKGAKLIIKVDKNYKTTEGQELPIGIYINGEEAPIAYVHEMKWVSKEEDNVAQVYQDLVENATKEIRDAVIAKGQIEAVITSKSLGHLNVIEDRGDENNSGYVNALSEVFGNQDIMPINRFGESKIIIAESVNSAFDGKDSRTQDRIANDLIPGAIYMQIPTGVKDVFFASFLDIAQLKSTNQTEVILKAIETHLKAQTKEIVGKHDISTIKGLVDFINEITFVGKNYTGGKATRTASTLDFNTGDDGTLYINVGATLDKGFDRNLTVVGKLERFDSIKDQLKSVLESKAFDVKKELLNSKSTHTTYKVEGDKIIEDKTYENYAEFLSKEVLKTNIHPEVTPSGERVFFTQPIIGYDINSEVKQDKTKETVETTDGKKELTVDKEDILNDLIDDESDIDFSLKQYKLSDLTLEQQSQIVNSIVSNLSDLISEGKNVSEAYDTTKAKFEKTKLYWETKGRLDRARILQLAIDNWEKTDNFLGFKKLAEIRLAQLGTTIDDNESVDEEGTLEKRNYSENAAWQTNPKDTASANLKRFLATIPVLDKNGKPVPSVIGTHTYYSVDFLFNDLLKNLHDRSFENIISSLQEMATANPIYNTILTKLNTGSKQRYNEFLSVMKKSYIELTTLNFDYNEKGMSAYSRTSNYNSATKLIIGDWFEAFKSSAILSEETEGDSIGSLKIDTNKAKELKARFDEVAKSDLSEDELVKLQATFSEIGISLDLRALKDLMVSSAKKYKLSFKDLLTSKLAHIFNTLVGDSKDKESNTLFEENNPFIDESDSLDILAKAQKKYQTDLYSESFRNASGNSYFSYVQPTYISDTVINLSDPSYRAQLKLSAFAGNSDYLRMIEESGDVSSVVKISYFDATKKNNSREPALEYSNMSKKMREMTRFNLYANQGNAKAKILGLTFSDKEKSILFEVTRVDHKSKEAKDMLFNIALGEFNRVKLTSNQIVSGDKKVFTKDYHDGAKMGLKFLLFKGMNDLTYLNSKGNEVNIFDEETGLTRTELLEGAIPSSLVLAIQNNVNKELKEWIELKKSTYMKEGIYTSDRENLFDKSYIRNKQTGINKKVSPNESLLDYAAADYVTNYAITIGNMIQIMHGDLALTPKKGVGLEGYLQKTTIEYFKRLAKDVAPGTEMPFKDTHFNTIFIQDVELLEEISAYGKHFGKTISATDAQELTTLQEHIDVMYGRGQLSDELYNSISAKEAKDEDFSEEEINTILQVQKPVYVNIDTKNGISKITYIKSSSYPLIKQLVKDSHLDTLRKFMKLQNVQRAAFTTAIKSGLPSKEGIVHLYDRDGNWIFNALETVGKIKSLPRDGFKIQQDNPLKDSDLTLEATQGRTLLTVDIPEDFTFDLDGKKISRNELKERFDNLHTEIVNRKWNDLLERLSVKEVNGTFDITSLSEFQKVIFEEALSREWGPNELEAIKLNADGTSFVIPLMFNPQGVRIESLLTSLITNNVTKIKLPGHSYIQGSSIGYEAEGKNIYTDSALKYMQQDETGFYSEVMIAWNNNWGKYEDFVKEDGTPNLDKIDKELLYLVGYRIPNQGHNSFLRLKVKKFLHPNVGDLMLVPSEVTLQMGSDFDVDKMNAYIYANKTVNDKLVKADSTENSIIDLYHSVLSHEKMQDYIFQPLDDEDLKQEIDRINKFHKTNENFKSILFDETSDKVYVDNKAGKFLTATTSLSATNHALSQEAHLYIKGDVSIVFKDDEGKVYEDKADKTKVEHPTKGSYLLDKVLGFTKKAISKVLKTLQSAAVDNAKDPKLSRANINKFTYSTSALIARAGFDESFIVPFMMQQSIVDYVSKMEQLNDPTQQFHERIKKDVVVKTLLAEYTKRAEIDAISELTAISKSEMDEALKQSSEENKTKDYYKLQAQILYNFIKYEEIAKELTQLQQPLTISSTGGVGKSLSDAKYKQTQVETAQEGFKYLGNTNAFFDGTFIGNMIEKALIKGNEIYKGLGYPYFEDSYSSIEAQIQSEIGRDKALSVDDLDDIHEQLKATLYSNGLFSTDNFSLRQELLIGENSLADRLQSYKGSNQFFKKLKVDLATIKDLPNYVYYVSSTVEESTDSLTNSIAWQEALESTDKDEKKLAEDLVKYAIVTGGIQSKNSFAKYIPTEYFAKITSEKAMLVNFKDEELFETTLRQYFQHNPWRSKQLTDPLSQLEGITKEIRKSVVDGKFSPKSFVLPTINKADINLLVGDVESKRLPNFISIRTSDRQKPWILYEQGATDKDGKVTYNQINTLGTGQFKEYDLTRVNNQSIYKFNNIDKKAVESPVVKNPELGFREELTTNNENIVKEILPSSLINSIKDNKLSDALKEIVASKGKLASLAEHIMPLLSGITSKIDNNLAAEGMREGMEITINPKMISSVEELHRVILEETIHAITIDKVSRFINDRQSLSENDLRALDALEALRKSALAKLKNADTETQYALSNLQEFTARALTNSKFQEKLNNVEFAGQKSLFGRLIEIINRLLGIEANPSSVLFQAVKNTLDIISRDNDNKSNDVDYSPNLSNARILNDKIFNKTVGLYKKEVSGLQTALISGRIKTYNAKNGTSYWVQFSRIGQSSSYSWKAYNLGATNQLDIDFSPKFDTKSTGDIGLDKALDRLYNQRLALTKSLTPANKTQTDIEIGDINKTIEQTLDKKDLNAIVQRANIQMNQVNKFLNETITLELLQKAQTYLDGWLGIEDIFDFTPGSEEQKKIFRILENRTILKKKWDEKAKDFLRDTINSKRPEDKQLTTKQLFSEQLDTNSAAALLLDSGVSRVALEQIFDDIYKGVHFDIQEEVTKKHKEIEEKAKELGIKNYQSLLQELKGKKTGFLVDQISQEYFDKTKELRNAAKENPKKWKEYWNFVKENTYQLSISEVEKGESKHFSEKEIKKAKELLDQYNKDREAFVEFEKERIALADVYENKDTDEKIMNDFNRNVAENIAKWERENSPYLREKTEKDVNSGKQKTVALKGMKGYKYMLYPKPKESWYDEKYKRLSSKELAFIDYFKSVIKDYGDYLPEDQYSQSNSIPELAKGLREQIMTSGLTSAYKGVKGFTDKITLDKLSETEYGVIDQQTGLPISELRTSMLGNKMSAEEKSYDLVNVLKAYVEMAANYKYKSAVESELKLVKHFIDNLDEAVSESDVIKKDWRGNPIVKKKGVENTKKRVAYTMGTFYGQYKKVEGVSKEIKSGPLKGKRVVSSYITDSLNQYTTAAGLGLNVFSGTTNLIFGLASNVLIAGGGESFNTREMFKGLSIMMGAATTKEGREKIATLMEKFQVLKEVNPAAYGGTHSVFDKIYFMQKMGEFIIQGNVMVSMMIHDKTWNNYNSKGEWIGKEAEPDYKAFAFKVQKEIKFAHGNYDKASPTAIKASMWGRLLMVFRNWIPYSAMNRFGKEYYDKDLQRTKKGRYRTWNPLTGGSIGYVSGLKNMLKLSLAGRLSGTQVTELSQVDKANLKTMLREITLASSIYLLTMLLRGMIHDDDDDTDKSIYTYWLNNAERIDNDLWFFASSQAFEQIIRDPIPAMKTLDNFINLTKATSHWVVGGDDIIHRGYNKGGSKTMKALRRSFPIFNQADKIEAAFNEIYTDLPNNH